MYVPDRTYADGSRVVWRCGVRIVCSRAGDVLALSDWSRADELEAAGVLIRDVWRGEGTCGHDTYRLP